MDSLATETEERDLERLFAEARRYPLLTSQQEKEIDGSKWDSVRGMLSLFTTDPAIREYLLDWASNAALTPIDIAFFEERDC